MPLPTDTEVKQLAYTDPPSQVGSLQLRFSILISSIERFWFIR